MHGIWSEVGIESIGVYFKVLIARSQETRKYFLGCFLLLLHILRTLEALRSGERATLHSWRWFCFEFAEVLE